MRPSEHERHAFIALTKLPTDEALYTALTQEKGLGKVRILYARLSKERARARRAQGIKYYRDEVADWWIKRKGNKSSKKAEILAKQAEMKANFARMEKVRAGQVVKEGYSESKSEKLEGKRPQEKSKDERGFWWSMPIRGPRI